MANKSVTECPQGTISATPERAWFQQAHVVTSQMSAASCGGDDVDGSCVVSTGLDSFRYQILQVAAHQYA